MARIPKVLKKQRVGFSWRERGLAALVMTLLAGVLWGGWGMFLSDRVQNVEKQWKDSFRSTLTPTPEREDLIFLGIDEETIALSAVEDSEIEQSEALQAMFDPLPWSRRVWAEAVNKLGGAGVKLVVIDLHFAGPLRRADGQELDPEGDRLFAEAIARHRDKVVLVSKWEEAGSGGKRQSIYVPPYEVFGKAGGEPVTTGYVNFWGESADSVFRYADFESTKNEVNGKLRHADEMVYLSLAAAVATKLGVEVPRPGRYLRFAGWQQVKGGPYVAAEAYPSESLYGIFAEGVWEANYKGGEFFKDKVVLIGASSKTMKDEVLVPTGILYGPQLHLQAVGCILEESFWFEAPSWWSWVALFGMAALAMVITSNIRSPLIVLVVALVIGALWVLGCGYAANLSSVLFTGFSGLLSLVFVTIGCEGAEFFFEQKERKELHRQLSRSVSPDVAEAMVRAPDGYLDAARGGRRTVAVLFSDVRNFTARSERMEPGVLVGQLNAYFTKMVESVFECGGSIDKFIGDAVMAVWGGLEDTPEEGMAKAALKAAEQMSMRLDELNGGWEEEGLEGFAVGIGIHIGDAVVGEIGSRERSDFTAIGDAVNVAARIEGMTKQLGVSLLVSGRVAEMAGGGFCSVGLFRVKGRDEPVEVCAMGKDAATWEAALEALRRRDTAPMRVLAEGAGEWAGPARFYVRRLEEEGGSVPEGWDGVVTLDSK